MNPLAEMAERERETRERRLCRSKDQELIGFKKGI
jgi:hypothetical protein